MAGAAAGAVGAAVTNDFKRTQREATEAQLRQMLLAGAADVARRLQSAELAGQERTIAFVSLLNRYGPALVDRLEEELPLEMGHHWIVAV